jgi:hypothetical protein
MIAEKVRKGEVVAIEIQHSSTDVQMKTFRYTRFVLATVAQASREGVARRVIMAGQTHSLEVARLGTVWTLPRHQEPGRRLIATMTYPGREFADKEELRAAFVELETARRESTQ